MDEIEQLTNTLIEARKYLANLKDRKDRLQARRAEINAELDSVNLAITQADADVTAARAALKAVL